MWVGTPGWIRSAGVGLGWDLGAWGGFVVRCAVWDGMGGRWFEGVS